MSGLCWKCKEGYDKELKFGVRTLSPYNTWVHCHHEPKEKPKCWCDDHVRGNIILANDLTINYKYCPECGRKL